MTSIFPRVVADSWTRQNYYRIGLEVPAEEERPEILILVPGMPVTTYLETGDRSVMSYLLATNHLRRLHPKVD